MQAPQNSVKFVSPYILLHPSCFQAASSLGDFVARFELGSVTSTPVAEPRRHLHLSILHLPAEAAQKESVPEEAVAPPPPCTIHQRHLKRHQSPSAVATAAAAAAAAAVGISQRKSDTFSTSRLLEKADQI